MDRLTQARQAILAPTGLQDSDIEKIMNSLLSAQVDAADIYFQSMPASENKPDFQMPKG
jgi:TldD protein